MILSGFGSLPAASWRGQRGRTVYGNVRDANASIVPGATALQQLVNTRQREAAAQFWSPSRGVESAQVVGAVPGSPVAAFNTMHFAGLGNLGLVNSWWCDPFEQAIETLGEVLRRAENAGIINNDAYRRAKTVHDEETSWLLYKRSTVGVQNCQAQTSRIALMISEVNSTLPVGSRVPVPSSVVEEARDARVDAGQEAPPEPTDPLTPTVKFAIIGGVVVAGIIGVAVITGNIASITKVFK
jgi:hypothetical protein